MEKFQVLFNPGPLTNSDLELAVMHGQCQEVLGSGMVSGMESRAFRHRVIERTWAQPAWLPTENEMVDEAERANPAEIARKLLRPD